MCGINGIWSESKVLPNEHIEQMNRALAHRGPDSHGVFATDNILLGHQRLSIIDLSSAANQPYYSADKRFVIIYNGELYNFKEIRAELDDYRFQTQTDTEVVLAAYLKWGKDCLQKFNGMFALAIWDSIEKKGFIARDRLGIKPLYYYRSADGLVFSSELRALIASNIVPRKLDQASLVDYLRYQTVHAPNTILKDVHCLMPGHFMEFGNGDVNIRSYWKTEDFAQDHTMGSSYKEVCGNVRELLHKAVERRLVADVPFGAFLSGGIDSSAVVSLMAQFVDEVNTFSVTFDEEEFSEAKYASIIAKKYKTSHHPIKLRASDFMNELPNALSAMDHPSGDGPNTYVVSKVTREAGITMALSGLGGDELFAGYDIFKRSLAVHHRSWINSFPKGIRSLMGDLLKLGKPGIASDKIAEILKLNNINPADIYHLSRQTLLDDQLRKLLRLHELPMNSVQKIAAKLGSHSGKAPVLSLVSQLEINTYMQNTLLRDADQMSMAHALEVRVPFLDHQLVEYVLGVSDQYKNPLTPKKLMVDALGDLVPQSVINRPKMGFTFPWEHWLKNELNDWAVERLKSLKERSNFEPQGVDDLWNGFLRGDQHVSWSRIWMLLVLDQWLTQNNIQE